ncbi:hypothetical protein GCM10009092_08530 [Bowmanella denitrificans]|uniref:CENP-V/GFA domain-containing protein n=1 Tax=Bowmanella denitrificans TaxID=366582 RepID=A0ABP3GK64_9ALTE
MHILGLSCDCGQLQGRALNVGARTGTRLVCYCDDCQAFARELGRADVLDSFGGTEIYQLSPAQLQFSQGQEHLRCLKLSEKGLLRWYAGCCNTPIGNTVSASMPLVGLIHSVFQEGQDKEALLGPVQGYVHGKFATAKPPAEKNSKGTPWRLLLRIVSRLLADKLSGRGKPHPLFDVAGKPVSEPRVLVK